MAIQSENELNFFVLLSPPIFFFFFSCREKSFLTPPCNLVCLCIESSARIFDGRFQG